MRVSTTGAALTRLFISALDAPKHDIGPVGPHSLVLSKVVPTSSLKNLRARFFPFSKLPAISFTSLSMSLGPAGASLSPEQADNFEDVFFPDALI